MQMEMGIKKLRDPGLFKPKIWIFAKKLIGTRAGGGSEKQFALWKNRQTTSCMAKKLRDLRLIKLNTHTYWNTWALSVKKLRDPSHRQPTFLYSARPVYQTTIWEKPTHAQTQCCNMLQYHVPNNLQHTTKVTNIRTNVGYRPHKLSKSCWRKPDHCALVLNHCRVDPTVDQGAVQPKWVRTQEEIWKKVSLHSWKNSDLPAKHFWYW